MAKTKALISFAVTAKLICVFVFVYANIRFSHVAAQVLKSHVLNYYFNLKVHVPISLRGYHPPEPPFMCIDDIRPTIPWFEEDTTQDEFDWPAVQEDLKDNLSTVMASGLSANTSKLVRRL